MSLLSSRIISLTSSQLHLRNARSTIPTPTLSSWSSLNGSIKQNKVFISTSKQSTRSFHSSRLLNSERPENFGQQQQERQSNGRGKSDQLSGSPVSWRSMIATLLTGAGLLAVYVNDQRRREKAMRDLETKSVGKAAVGGPFTLVDVSNGKPVTDAQYRGKYQILYFGFTHCPDICPTELTKLGKVLDALEKKGLGDNVVPIFITVDPLRDTIEKVRQYIKDFHPKLIGLTGTPTQVQETCKKYRVYFSKTFETQGENEDDDYLVDHTIILYLMDPKGEFVAFFGNNLDDVQITERMENILTGTPEKGKKGFFSSLLGQ